MRILHISRFMDMLKIATHFNLLSLSCITWSMHTIDLRNITRHKQRCQWIVWMFVLLQFSLSKTNLESEANLSACFNVVLVGLIGSVKVCRGSPKLQGNNVSRSKRRWQSINTWWSSKFLLWDKSGALHVLMWHYPSPPIFQMTAYSHIVVVVGFSCHSC